MHAKYQSDPVTSSSVITLLLARRFSSALIKIESK